MPPDPVPISPRIKDMATGEDYPVGYVPASRFIFSEYARELICLFVECTYEFGSYSFTTAHALHD